MKATFIEYLCERRERHTTAEAALGTTGAPSVKTASPAASIHESLYSNCVSFRTLRTSEADCKQHSGRNPFLWSRHTTILTISRIFNPIREVFAPVVGRVLPHPNRCATASYPSILPFQCTLPSRLDVPRDTAKLRGRQREDSFIRYLEYDANIRETTFHFHTTTSTRESPPHQYRCTRRNP